MSKAALGTGSRFKAVEKKAAASGAKNPAAVAASAGRAKFGGAKMEKMAEHGKSSPGKPFRDADVGGPVGSSFNHGASRKPGSASGLHEMGKTVPTFEEARHAKLERRGSDDNASVPGPTESFGKPGHGKDD